VGVAIFNTGEADINGDNQITFNGGLSAWRLSIPVQCSCLMESSTATPASDVHCGESSHCEWSGVTQINSNTGGGIEITDHSDGYIDGGITISGNTGVGILVDLSSLLNSLGGNTISTIPVMPVVLNTCPCLSLLCLTQLPPLPENGVRTFLRL